MLPSKTWNMEWRGRGLCGGNIITATKSWGRWRMGDDIRPISHCGPGWPAQARASPRNTDQSLLQPPQKPKKGRLNYANLQDKYILILLEYKLMPQLSDQTLCYKRRKQEYKITLSLQVFYSASKCWFSWKTRVEEIVIPHMVIMFSRHCALMQYIS